MHHSPEMDDFPHVKGMALARLNRLLVYAVPHWRRLVLAGLSLGIAGALGLVYPLYFGQVIDAAFKEKDLQALNASALTLVVIFALQGVFSFFRHYLVAWVGERAVADLRVQIYRHIVTLPQSFFHRTRTGELLSAM